MAQVSELPEQGQRSEEFPKRSKVSGRLTAGRMLLSNSGALKKLMVMGPDEPRFVRRPREYELPKYRKGTKHCKSNEKYLRPTWWCNPREPLIVAMAHELGAYELSDYEFAEAAYWFVKTKLAAEMRPLDSASAVLKRGTGMCYGLTSLWLALCRAVGIKGRYQVFTMHLPDEVTSMVSSQQSTMTVDFFNRGTPEAQGEVYVDGKWTIGHVAMRPELFAVAGLPVTKFGEDSIDMTFELIPGTVQRFESLPLRIGIAMKVGMWLAPAIMERANVSAQKRGLQGRLIIEKAGGVEAYDTNVRRMRELYSLQELLSTAKLKRDEAIVFEKD